MATVCMGIDGGSLKAGMAIVSATNDEQELITARLIRMDVVPYKERSAPERLFYLCEVIRDAVIEFRPDIISIEHIRVNNGGFNMDSYLVSAKAQQSAVIGALLAAKEHNIPIKIIQPMASQVRARLGIKAKKRKEAKDEVRKFFNKKCEIELLSCGFVDTIDGPVGKSICDVTDAVSYAWTARSFM